MATKERKTRGQGRGNAGKFGDPRTIFASLYESGAWDGGKVDSSGKGADLEERRPYVDHVVRLFGMIKPKSVVDLGSGDGRVLADVASQYPKAKYVGADVYAPHLKMLKSKLKHHEWLNLDFTDVAKIPAADVWLCKDVLHHWPNEIVAAFLRDVFTTKRCKTLVLCFDCNQRFDGETCPLGGYRAMNTEWRPLRDVLIFPGVNVDARVNFLHKSILQIGIR